MRVAIAGSKIIINNNNLARNTVVDIKLEQVKVYFLVFTFIYFPANSNKLHVPKTAYYVEESKRANNLIALYIFKKLHKRFIWIATF